MNTDSFEKETTVRSSDEQRDPEVPNDQSKKIDLDIKPEDGEKPDEFMAKSIEFKQNLQKNMNENRDRVWLLKTKLANIEDFKTNLAQEIKNVIPIVGHDSTAHLEQAVQMLDHAIDQDAVATLYQNLSRLTTPPALEELITVGGSGEEVQVKINEINQKNYLAGKEYADKVATTIKSLMGMGPTAIFTKLARVGDLIHSDAKEVEAADQQIIMSLSYKIDQALSDKLGIRHINVEPGRKINYDTMMPEGAKISSNPMQNETEAEVTKEGYMLDSKLNLNTYPTML